MLLMKKIIYALFQIHNIYTNKNINDDLKLRFISVVLSWINKDLIRNVNRFSEEEMIKYVESLDSYKSNLEKEQEKALS